MSLSKLTNYWACHEKWISWLILVTHETLFTMRGVTTVIVQTHQILRLPRKMNLMIDPCHTWNAIYNARSNKCHCPNSPNTAPATQSNTHHWSLSHMKRYLQCAEQQVSLSKLTKYCACHAKWLSWYCHDWSSSHMKRYLQCAEQQVASSNITKYCACHAKWLSNISKKFLENSWNVISNAGPIRAGSELDPSWIRPWSENETVIRNPPRNRGYFSGPPRAFCIEKYNISRSGYHSKFHRILRLPRKVTLQLHRILRLPRKMTVMILSWLILVTYETLFTMRGTTGGILQHHQILRLPRKMTLQHFKEIYRKQLKRHFQCGADPRMIREWSENDPSNIRATSEQETVRRNPPRNRGYFSGPPRAFCIEKYNISRSGYHSKFHRILRLPRKVTLQLHQILRLPRKMNLMIDPCHTWNAIYNARSNKCHCPNSPNTAPATQNETHDWSAWHMKRYLQCAEQPVASSNITKYCACHAKWLSWLILVTYETLFTMRGTTGGILQHHQILRLPRKMTLQHFKEISRKQMKRQFQCATDPRPFREWSDHDPRMKPSSATRLATEVTFQDHHEHFVLKNTTFRAPAIIPNFTEYCACHEKWHFNFTEYCACHEKWHLNVTK